jgi:hypothetical protein
MAVNPNLIDSDIFSSAKWQKSGQIEITPNYVTTPSFKRAHKLINHNGDSDYLQYAPNSLPAGTYTLSIETKGETGNFTLEVDGPNWQGGAVITVNPTTGAVVTAARAYSNQTFVTAVSGKSFANPDTEKGGYIVSLTYTTSLAGVQPLLWPEAGKSVGVWGVKLENGTEATYATPGSPAVVEVPDEHDVRFVRHCGGIATADPNDTSGRAINDAALAQYYEVRKKFLVAASVLKMPVGYIHFSKTPRFINGFHHVKGLGGGIGGVDGTFIRVPGDQDGIQVDQANTNGLSPVAGPAHDSAAGSIFEGLGIWSMSNFGAKDPNTGLFVDPTYYRKRTGVTDPNDPTSGRSPASGILLRTRAIIRNCRISGFPGMGIYVIAADAWGWNGNANGWEVHSTRAEFCGDAGLYIIGETQTLAWRQTSKLATAVRGAWLTLATLATATSGIRSRTTAGLPTWRRWRPIRRRAGTTAKSTWLSPTTTMLTGRAPSTVSPCQASRQVFGRNITLRQQPTTTRRRRLRLGSRASSSSQAVPMRLCLR